MNRSLLTVAPSVFLSLGVVAAPVGCSNGGSTTAAGGSTSASSSASTSSATSTKASSTASASTTGATSSSSASSSSGGPVTCLPPSASAPYFTVETTDLCVVAIYTAPALTLGFQQPTWGRHNGPLTSTVMAPTPPGMTADVHLERWALSGTTLTKTETIAPVTNIAQSDFWSGQLLDLLADQSVIAWTGANPMTDGQMVFVTNTTEKTSLLTTGVYAFARVGPDAGGITRLLYTGTSAVGGPNAKPGLYADDVHADGSSAGASAAISIWGEATGPVATDGAGNVVAINTKFSDGTQEMRGFEASTIKPLAGASAGDLLLDTMGFGSSLAAIAPTSTKPGLAAFQPQTGNAGTNQDVLVVRYTSAAPKLQTSPAVTLLKLTVANTGFTLMTDNTDQLWVGATSTTGTGTTFLVLARPS